MENKLTTTTENKLIVTQKEDISLAKKMIKHTPSLVKSIDCRKIREYSSENKIMMNEMTITYILSLLGISDNNEEKLQHYLAVDVYISEDLGNYSYEEVKEAFKMYIKGTFKDFFDKVIYKLDCVILANVMAGYELEKIKLTKIYKEKVAENLRNIQEERNKLNEKQKLEWVLFGLKDSYVEYKNKGSFNNISRLYLYDFLNDKNLLPKDKATKEAVVKVAVENIKKRGSGAITREEKALFKIMEDSKNYSNIVINECKRISIIRCFDNFAKYEQLLNKINKS